MTTSAASEKGSQSHKQRDRYARYHTDVWMPAMIREDVARKLPLSGTRMRLGFHYFAEDRRRTPDEILMPARALCWLIDVTQIRATGEIVRCCIRYEYDGDRDLCLVVEFASSVTPHTPRPTVVTAYWNRRGDRHQTLDVDVYEQDPEKVSARCSSTV